MGHFIWKDAAFYNPPPLPKRHSFHLWCGLEEELSHISQNLNEKPQKHLHGPTLWLWVQAATILIQTHPTPVYSHTNRLRTWRSTAWLRQMGLPTPPWSTWCHGVMRSHQRCTTDQRITSSTVHPKDPMFTYMNWFYDSTNSSHILLVSWCSLLSDCWVAFTNHHPPPKWLDSMEPLTITHNLVVNEGTGRQGRRNLVVLWRLPHNLYWITTVSYRQCKPFIQCPYCMSECVCEEEDLIYLSHPQAHTHSFSQVTHYVKGSHKLTCNYALVWRLW